MPSNTNFLRRLKMLSPRSTSKNLRKGISKLLPDLNSDSLSTYLTVMSVVIRYMQPFKVLLGRMIDYISIAILAQTIRMLFSIQSDFVWLLVLVATLFWTTSLWLLAVLHPKPPQTRSTTSRRASK